MDAAVYMWFSSIATFVAGVALLWLKVWRGTGWLLTIGSFGLWAVSMSMCATAVHDKATTATTATPQQAATPDNINCRADLHCWGEKHATRAATRCSDPIERLAKHTFRWTTDTVALRFRKFTWRQQQDGTLTYGGDEIEFQNGFGAWTRYKYFCDFDPATMQVLKVGAMPGRL